MSTRKRVVPQEKSTRTEGSHGPGTTTCLQQCLSLENRLCRDTSTAKDDRFSGRMKQIATLGAVLAAVSLLPTLVMYFIACSGLHTFNPAHPDWFADDRLLLPAAFMPQSQLAIMAVWAGAVAAILSAVVQLRRIVGSGEADSGHPYESRDDHEHFCASQQQKDPQHQLAWAVVGLSLLPASVSVLHYTTGRVGRESMALDGERTALQEMQTSSTSPTGFFGPLPVQQSTISSMIQSKSWMAYPGRATVSPITLEQWRQEGGIQLGCSAKAARFELLGAVADVVSFQAVLDLDTNLAAIKSSEAYSTVTKLQLMDEAAQGLVRSVHETYRSAATASGPSKLAASLGVPYRDVVDRSLQLDAGVDFGSPTKTRDVIVGLGGAVVMVTMAALLIGIPVSDRPTGYHEIWDQCMLCLPAMEPYACCLTVLTFSTAAPIQRVSAQTKFLETAGGQLETSSPLKREVDDDSRPRSSPLRRRKLGITVSGAPQQQLGHDQQKVVRRMQPWDPEKEVTQFVTSSSIGVGNGIKVLAILGLLLPVFHLMPQPVLQERCPAQVPMFTGHAVAIQIAFKTLHEHTIGVLAEFPNLEPSTVLGRRVQQNVDSENQQARDFVDAMGPYTYGSFCINPITQLLGLGLQVPNISIVLPTDAAQLHLAGPLARIDALIAANCTVWDNYDAVSSHRNTDFAMSVHVARLLGLGIIRGSPGIAVQGIARAQQNIFGVEEQALSRMETSMTAAILLVLLDVVIKFAVASLLYRHVQLQSTLMLVSHSAMLRRQVLVSRIRYTSHEVRQPLNSIVLGLAEIQDQRQMVKDMQARMTGLLKQMAQYSVDEVDASTQDATTLSSQALSSEGSVPKVRGAATVPQLKQQSSAVIASTSVTKTTSRRRKVAKRKKVALVSESATAGEPSTLKQGLQQQSRHHDSERQRQVTSTFSKRPTVADVSPPTAATSSDQGMESGANPSAHSHVVSHAAASPIRKGALDLSDEIRRCLADLKEVGTELDEVLPSMGAATDAMISVLDDVSALQKIEAGKLTVVPRPCDLVPTLLRTTATAFRAWASGRGVQLSVLRTWTPDRAERAIARVLTGPMAFSHKQASGASRGFEPTHSSHDGSVRLASGDAAGSFMTERGAPASGSQVSAGFKGLNIRKYDLDSSDSDLGSQNATTEIAARVRRQPRRQKSSSTIACKVLADSPRLQQVFSNLASNGVKHAARVQAAIEDAREAGELAASGATDASSAAAEVDGILAGTELEPAVLIGCSPLPPFLWSITKQRTRLSSKRLQQLQRMVGELAPKVGRRVKAGRFDSNHVQDLANETEPGVSRRIPIGSFTSGNQPGKRASKTGRFISEKLGIVSGLSSAGSTPEPEQEVHPADTGESNGSRPRDGEGHAGPGLNETVVSGSHRIEPKQATPSAATTSEQPAGAAVVPIGERQQESMQHEVDGPTGRRPGKRRHQYGLDTLVSFAVGPVSSDSDAVRQAVAVSSLALQSAKFSLGAVNSSQSGNMGQHSRASDKPISKSPVAALKLPELGPLLPNASGSLDPMVDSEKPNLGTRPNESRWVVQDNGILPSADVPSGVTLKDMLRARGGAGLQSARRILHLCCSPSTRRNIDWVLGLENGDESEAASFEAGSERGVNHRTACFWSWDGGPGIAAADRPKVFVEFSQLNSGVLQDGQGTGLGLAISQAIVEMHRGVIGWVSSPGAGCIFFFLVRVEMAPGLPGSRSRRNMVAAASSGGSAQSPAKGIGASNVAAAQQKAQQGGLAAAGQRWSRAEAHESAGAATSGGTLDKVSITPASKGTTLGISSGGVGSGAIVSKTSLSAGIAHMAGSQSTSAWRSASRPVVMVVDDSRANRRMLQRLLQRLGCDVLLGEDGQDALDKMVAPVDGKKRAAAAGGAAAAGSAASGDLTGTLATAGPIRTVGETVALVLLDYSMPRMDGPTFAAALQQDERYASIPIVGVTGNVLEQDREFFLAAGAVEIAMKPVGRDKVRDILRRRVGL